MVQKFDCDKCPYVMDGAHRVYKVGSKNYCSYECPNWQKAHQQEVAKRQLDEAQRLARALKQVRIEQLSFEFGDG